MDSQLEDFLNRFGDPEDVARGNRPAVKTIEPLTLPKMEVAEGPGLVAPDTTALKNSVKPQKTGQDLAKEGNFDGGAAAADVMEMAPQAMGLLSSFQGKDFDTSAEGGGVGNGQGAILQGASNGMQLGMKVGGPWGAAIGAVVGGGGTALAHGKAQREYMDNRQTMHQKNDAISNAENRNRYAMQNEEESMQVMKGLYKKQLGIV